MEVVVPLCREKHEFLDGFGVCGARRFQIRVRRWWRMVIRGVPQCWRNRRIRPDSRSGERGDVEGESFNGEGDVGGAVVGGVLDANPVNRATGHLSPMPC